MMKMGSTDPLVKEQHLYDFYDYDFYLYDFIDRMHTTRWMLFNYDPVLCRPPLERNLSGANKLLDNSVG